MVDEAINRITAAPPGLPSFVIGQCNVCGNDAKFYFSEPSLYREQLKCDHCGSVSRYRSLARGVLLAFQQLTGISVASLAQLPKTGIGRSFDVYDTQPPFYWDTCSYPIPDYLKATDYSNVSLSNFKPDLSFGEMITPGISNQNLEHLKFSSNSFDLVITTDVMEHVRLDVLAHREIHRILRLGGVYIFTVPHSSELKETLVRVKVNDPNDISKDEFLLPPEYHGDANSESGSGVLSYRVYGTDLNAFLEDLGFEVTYFKDDIAKNAILNTELFYCRKIR